MKRLVIALMALVIPTAGRGQAQPPSLSAARLHVSVARDAGDVFVYRYTLENAAGSNAGIARMVIDISMPAGASAPSAAGLKNGPGYFVTSPGAVKSLKTGVPVPVGLSAPQPGWRTTVGTDATARWVSADDKSLVLPKQRLGGLSLTSHGPPAIRRFALAPHVDPRTAPVVEIGDDALEAERFDQELEQYIESRSVTGMTLAPTAPVARTADAMLATLASQVAQARTLRWISTDGIARNITDKLQAARGAISGRQPEQAVSILRGLRTDVAAQAGKALTTEAVALVDLNVQYTLPLVGKP
jgi:hypothetical protein